MTKLFKASFRNIPFHVAERSINAGRRIAVHEFALSNEHATQDTGRKARRYPISGHVIGDDYEQQKLSLIEACEREGVGVLVHPEFGSLNVRCDSIEFRVAEGENRIAYFSANFIEAGLSLVSETVIDRSEEALIVSSELRNTAIEDFVSRVNLTSVSEFVRDDFAGMVSAFGSNFAEIEAPIDLTEISEQSSIDDIASLYADINLLAQNPKSQLNDISGLASKMSSIAERATSVLGSTAIDALQNSSWSTSSINPDAVNNGTAANDFINVLTASSMADDAINSSYESYDDAIGSREKIIQRLEAIESTASDDVYSASRKLKTSVVYALPAEEENLPRISQINQYSSSPSLLLSYKLYDDLGKAQQITDRNSVVHPGFIGGADPLEVLIDNA